MLFPLLRRVSGKKKTWRKYARRHLLVIIKCFWNCLNFYPPLIPQKPLSRGGLTILNKGATLWSSSVVKQPPRGRWKCVFDLCLNQVPDSESQRRRAPRNTKNSARRQHSSHCQRSRLILCAWKFDWKRMQMASLICIAPMRWWCRCCYQFEPTYIAANKAGGGCEAFWINSQSGKCKSSGFTCLFFRGWRSEVILKSARRKGRKKQQKKQTDETLKFQSRRMIDSRAEFYHMVRGNWALISDRYTHSQYASQNVVQALA